MVTFATHSPEVDGEATLPFIASDPSEKITRTGFTVDDEYEKEHLSESGKMSDSTTDKLNVGLLKNPANYNEELVSSVKIDDKETMGSLATKLDERIYPIIGNVWMK